ncbi:HtaA domain-containing protein [Streptomyces sp. NBC_00059]|uniref:HtaA domain-containing protein n=1 Tax=Streptomyces sp. NBC_00059 TaxID=2975635 RepID=UPI00224DB9F0|nr:HtaA domain-containing protein [Streptomyces sp. NBC_00059]MCX5412977.1 HtaA domain-containing protein [Streptomyces sp. NBC_00059]
MQSSPSARALCVALFAVLLGALLPATAAQAAGRTVQGGRLDWGIKSSFQSYVTGSIAQGSWSLDGGAATVGGSQFRFHSATGSYDPANGAFTAGFSGGVHFVGHRQDDGTNQLDLIISRPTIRISGGAGTLYADMVSKERGSGRVTSSSQVPLATLGLSGIDMRGGSTPVALTGIPATLTSQGASAFAGYYAAGTPLDPVSLSVDTEAPAAAKQPSRSAEPSPSPSATKKKESAGRVEDAAVDWGVRRTFREYVTGSIGRGKWTLSGGAQDGGALFRFPQGTGTYDAGKKKLDAAFAGSVRFTGADGLDLELAGFAARVASGKGTLLADVTSGGTTDKGVPLVTFAAKDFTPEDGLAVLTEAPATLTADGAKAFGSLYKAGTAMDPVSLAVAVDATAELPALPDLGSEAEPSAAPATTAAGTPAAQPAAESGSLTPYAVGGGAALVAACAAVLYAARRRRGARNG